MLDSSVYPQHLPQSLAQGRLSHDYQGIGEMFTVAFSLHLWVQMQLITMLFLVLLFHLLSFLLQPVCLKEFVCSG